MHLYRALTSFSTGCPNRIPRASGAYASSRILWRSQASRMASCVLNGWISIWLTEGSGRGNSGGGLLLLCDSTKETSSSRCRTPKLLTPRARIWPEGTKEERAR